MDSWTPQAVAELIAATWKLGAGAIGTGAALLGWYFACRYGWPGSQKGK